MKHLLSYLLLILLAPFAVHAQSGTLTFPLDIKQGILNGDIVVTHSALDIGNISNAFDSDLNNVARSAGINPMVVTLQNPTIFHITSTSFVNNTEATLWTVEAAMTLADLNSHSGSYQVLVNVAPHSGAAPSVKSVNAQAKVLRLTMQKQCCDAYVHLQEWGITATVTVNVTGICMKPNDVRLIPQSAYQPAWFGSDAQGNEFPLPSAGMSWSSSNPAVVSVNGSGVFAAGGNLGESTVTASWNGLNYQTKVKVVQDFVAPPAEKRVVKVAMIVIDPPIPAAGGQRFSEKFWSFLGGPMALAQQTRDSIFSVSGGTIDYQFTEIHQENDLSLNHFGGIQLSVDSLYKLFLEPGQATLHQVAEQLGQSQFEYNALLNKYNLCEKSNTHQIDEVWVWAMPFIGMYESNMAGTDAFWINGPVVTGNACTDLLPIMGFNYERYAGCALHNFTHRIELTMAKVYNTSYRYVPTDPAYPAGPKDPWRTFMLYDALESGNAQVGNGHFPPNGTENYDYDNLNFVPTKALNWKRYPYLFDQTEPINCTAWGCEIDCGINYCSWWLHKLPHFKCKDKVGRLNNWWTYIIDYNEGKAMEAQISDCNCKMFEDDATACTSKGNYPWEDWIAKVQLGTQENASGKSQYSDFTGTTFAITNNSAISLTSKYSYFTFNEYWRVWIDLNGDNDFEDAGEKVFEQVLSAPPNGNDVSKSITGNISLPSGVTGTKRMRVSMKRGGYPTPCEVFANGEVEDYTVHIAAGLPDLFAPNWEIIPTNVCYTNPGQSMAFYGATLVNSEAAPTGIFNVVTVLSKDAIVSADDVLWQSRSFPSLSTSNIGSYPGGLDIDTPIPASLPVGMYYAITTIDPSNTVAELNEANNVHIDWLRIGTPDFVINSVTDIPGTFPVGTSVLANVLVQNIIPFPVFELSPVINGVYAPGGAMEVEMYFSADNQFQVGTDPLVGTHPLAYSDFNTQGFASTPIYATLPPAGTQQGNYFLFVKLNVCDKLGSNNVSAAIPIQVGAVQPTTYCAAQGNAPWQEWIARIKFVDVDNTSGKSKYSDFTNQTINVNAGSPALITLTAGFSYTTYDEYWKVWIDYNQNGVFEEATETYLSITAPHPANGTSLFPISTSAFIKGGFTQDFTTRVRIAMKRGSYPTPCGSFENGEVEDYSIHIAPGGGQNRADLSTTNFVAPSSGSIGSVVPYTFDVVNNGTANVSGNYTIAAFLSTDNQLSASDVLVGTVPTGNTPIGTIANVQGSITIPTLPIGNYYLLLAIDNGNLVPEINELNNVNSRPFVVTGGSNVGVDLAVSIALSLPNPAHYGYFSATVTATNQGNAGASGVKVKIPTPTGVKLQGGNEYSPTTMAFSPYLTQEWTVGTLSAGQSKAITVNYFRKSAATASFFVQVIAQNEPDIDSQPNNGTCCTPQQDDEAVVSYPALNLSNLVAPDPQQPVFETADDFEFFPNPAGEYVQIVLKSWKNIPVQVEIINHLGYTVMTQTIEAAPSTQLPITLNLSSVMNGHYFLRLRTEGQRDVVKNLVVARLY